MNNYKMVLKKDPKVIYRLKLLCDTCDTHDPLFKVIWPEGTRRIEGVVWMLHEGQRCENVSKEGHNKRSFYLTDEVKFLYNILGDREYEDSLDRLLGI